MVFLLFFPISPLCIGKKLHTGLFSVIFRTREQTKLPKLGILLEIFCYAIKNNSGNRMICPYILIYSNFQQVLAPDHFVLISYTDIFFTFLC